MSLQGMLWTEDLAGEFTPVAWYPGKGRIDLDAYGAILERLRREEGRRDADLSSLRWWIGDALRHGESEHDPEFFQITEDTDYHRSAYWRWRYTSEVWEPKDRYAPDGASIWIHYETLRKTPGGGQILTRAERVELVGRYASGEI